jgi:Tfp pilus assembly protein PilZ
MRSPLFGFNHNFRHLGFLFHVQTEDTGLRSSSLVTHLFHRGVILATRKLVYEPSWSETAVRNAMQSQHKTVLKELRDGVHDGKIRALLREGTATTDPPICSSAPVASWPAEEEKSSLEWRSDTDAEETPAPPRPPVMAARGATLLQFPAVQGGAPRPSFMGMPMRGLQAHYPSRAALLETLYPNGRLGGLVVSSSVAFPLDEAVLLQVRVAAEVDINIHVLGRTAWRTHDGTAYGVEFPAHEQPMVRKMLVLVRGTRAVRPAGSPRPSTGSGAVTVTDPKLGPIETVADVTERGLFVPELLTAQPGSIVPVTLSAFGDVESQQVACMVEWRDEARAAGCGLRFPVENVEQRERIQKWVDALLRW